MYKDFAQTKRYKISQQQNLSVHSTPNNHQNYKYDFLENIIKILHLTLKKEWFDKILSKEKKIEYRQIKPYWTTRFFDKEGNPRKFDLIEFKNGYSKNARKMLVEYKGIRIGKDNHIIENGKEVYEILLGKIINQG